MKKIDYINYLQDKVKYTLGQLHRMNKWLLNELYKYHKNKRKELNNYDTKSNC